MHRAESQASYNKRPDTHRSCIDCLSFNLTQYYSQPSKRVGQPAILWGDKALIEFMQESVLPTIEKVFDDLDVANTSILLDTLSIDLGNFSIGELYHSLPHKLYDSLRQEIEGVVKQQQVKQQIENSKRLDHQAEVYLNSTDKIFKENDAKASSLTDEQCKWLDTIFIEKDARSLVVAWPDLIKNGWHGLTHWCCKQLTQTNYQRFVATQLPINIVHDIFHLLDNNHAEFMIRMLEQYQRMTEGLNNSKWDNDAHYSEERRLLKKSDSSISVDQSLAYSQAIEFSLAYLSCERGGRFNKKSYLRSLLRQLAVHYNQKVGDLCQCLQYVINDIVIDKEIKQDLLELLQEEASAEKNTGLSSSEKAQQVLNYHISGVCEGQAVSKQWLRDLLGYGRKKQKSIWLNFFHKLSADEHLLNTFCKQLNNKESDLLLEETLAFYQYQQSQIGYIISDSDINHIKHENKSLSYKNEIVAQITKFLTGKEFYDKELLTLNKNSPTLIHERLSSHWPAIVKGFISFIEKENYLSGNKNVDINVFSQHYSKQKLHQYIEKALSYQAEILYKAICASENTSLLIKILCQCLSVSLLRRFIHRVNPYFYRTFNQYAEILPKLLQDSNILVAPSEDIYWQSCLYYIAESDRSNIDVEGFVRVLLSVAGSYSNRKKELGRTLLSLIPAQLKITPNKPEWINLETALKATLTKEPNIINRDNYSDSDLPTSKQQKKTKWLLQKFEYFLLGNQWIISDKYWRLLCQRKGKQLRNLLVHNLSIEKRRQHFLDCLPDKKQIMILNVIDPKATEAILIVWSDKVRKVPNTIIKNVVPTIQDQQHHFSDLLKSFTITYLVSERGSEFNRRSFGRSLLRQLSAHYNINYDNLMSFLQSALLKQDIPLEFQPYLSEVLGMENDESNELQLTEPLIKAESAQQGAVLYDQLQLFLSRPLAVSDRQWVEVLTKINKQHFHYWQQIVCELQVGVKSLNLMLHYSSLPILDYVLALMLQTTGHVNTKDGSSIADAIKRYAKRSINIRQYYGEAIKAILAGGVIDLQAIEVSVKQYTLSNKNKDNIELGDANNSSADSSTTHISIDSNKDIKNIDSADNSLADKVGLSDGEKICYQDAIKTIQSLKSNQQKALAFTRQSESQQLALFMAADKKKTLVLLPYIQKLRLAFMACRFPLSHDEISYCLYQSLVSQFTYSFTSANSDRLIQMVINSFLSLLKQKNSQCQLLDIQQRLMEHLYAHPALNDRQALHKNSVDKIRDDIQSSLLSLSPVDVGLKPAIARDSTFSENTINQAETIEKTALSQEIEVKDNLEEKDKRLDSKEGIWVDNAGIVLLSPYIPLLFDKLQLLDSSKKQFINTLAQTKAISALNFIATGQVERLNDIEEIESGLTLQKIVSGLDVNKSLERLPLLKEEEINLCNSLLEGIIQHWNTLGHTRIDGLREVFLQREGNVQYDEEKGWLLKVEQRSFDVLLDRLPWSYNTIKHQFMDDVVYVEWR